MPPESTFLQTTSRLPKSLLYGSVAWKNVARVPPPAKSHQKTHRSQSPVTRQKMYSKPPLTPPHSPSSPPSSKKKTFPGPPPLASTPSVRPATRKFQSSHSEA